MSTEIITNIFKYASDHGPSVFILIVIIGCLLWWMRYIVAPKAKKEADNNALIAKRQITFIDNIEKMNLEHAKTMQYIAESNKKILEILKSINHNESQNISHAVDCFNKSICAAADTLESADFSKDSLLRLAIRIKGYSC